MSTGAGRRKALLLFARYPFSGQVKTRLAAGVGSSNARLLYSCFLKDIAAQVRRVDAEVYVFFTPSSAAAELKEFFGPGFRCLPQRGGTLGEKLKNAFRAVFEKGARSAVVIGSDLPGLGAARIRAAFARLEQDSAVIGPALDGGYYLLGLRPEFYAGSVFEDISWSSPHVFAETMERLGRLGVAPAVLGPLADIDDLAGLKRFYQGGEGRKTAPATVDFIDWALGGLAPYENTQE